MNVGILLYVGVKNLKAIDDSNASLIITWDAAASSSCEDVLLYLVTISYHQDHSNVMSNSVIVTDLSKLTATFSNLRKAVYNVTVAAVNRIGVGMTSMVMTNLTSGINENSACPTVEEGTHIRVMNIRLLSSSQP